MATLSGDPTNTRALRERFLREVARRFRALRGAIRAKVGYEEDFLQLRQDAMLAVDEGPDDSPTPSSPFDFPRRTDLIRQFLSWLEEQIRSEVLEPVRVDQVPEGSHWTATYIRAAYGKGWENATGRLLQEGVDVQNRDLDVVFGLPVPASQLRDLYTRAYSNLEGITADMADTIREQLLLGLAEGVNPREMARRINDEVQDITNTRAKVLARTEVINSYSTATLDRFETAGVGTVRHGEWATAGDDRVCPICEALEGREFTISEMRTGTFEFEAAGEDVPDHLAGEYRLKPPAHPNGRCTILPVVT